MAKKATSTGSGAGTRTGKTPGSGRASKPTRAVSRPRAGSGDDAGEGGNAAADAFLKILQSPIVADLLAVAATAALAALAEHGFSSRGAGDKRRAGRAVKEAGKAAAAAIGRRLATEVDEIRKASRSKAGEAA